MPKRQEDKTTAVDRAVGKRVLITRQERNVSQQDLAAELGISFQQLQKYERGTNRISAGRLFEIASYFGVRPSYFFQDVEVAGNGKVVVRDPNTPILGSNLNNEALRFLAIYSRLKSDGQKRTIVRFIEGLGKSGLDAEGG